MKHNTTVPPNYIGREQAFIKHMLLKSYLEKLLMIIGVSARSKGKISLCYVDCFAGPWCASSDDLSGTSIAISLKTLKNCQDALGKLGISATVRALYIEKNPKAFAKLSKYLAHSTPQGMLADCMYGDFEQLRGKILQWCGKESFTFFFIDPKGWSKVGVNILKPLLERPRSEFLINFMYDFVNRTASMERWKEQISYLLGSRLDDLNEIQSLSARQREERLIRIYRNGLCKQLKASKAKPRTAHVRVLDPNKDRVKYHLVYLTRHPKGIIEFMRISESVSLVQRRVRIHNRIIKREQDAFTADLFGQDISQELPPNEHDVSDYVIDEFWRNALSIEPTRVDEFYIADVLEATGWMESDLQASLSRLIESGEVKNLDSKRRRASRPLHYKKSGERLILVRRDAKNNLRLPKTTEAK